MEEMKSFYKAIMGDPELGTFGYVGDVGSLPSTLEDLVARPSGVSSFAAYTNGVRYGWRGPYITTRYNDFLDGWGTPYRYGQSPDGAGQIRSAGKDKTFDTNDDILFPQRPVNIYGTLLVSSSVNGIPNPRGVTVEVFYPRDGVEVNPTDLKLWTKQTANDPTEWNGFTFSVVHGIRVIRLSFSSDPPKLTNVCVLADAQVHQKIFTSSDETVRP
ncbi:MAG: type II secretion system protein GspG [Candidatus Latescibacter sp.]|nr:type II secretion system protein GspG [Candidatus Latescibacter sp.]